MLVVTINICELGPDILTHSNLTLLPRPLAILNACIKLRGIPQEQTYDIEASSLLSDQYPNMVEMPTIHFTPNRQMQLFYLLWLTC